MTEKLPKIDRVLKNSPICFKRFLGIRFVISFIKIGNNSI